MTFEVACQTCNDLVDILAGRVDGMYRGIMASSWLYNALMVVLIAIGVALIWRLTRGWEQKQCKICPVRWKERG